jgi:molecular chaperone GrpE
LGDEQPGDGRRSPEAAGGGLAERSSEDQAADASAEPASLADALEPPPDEGVLQAYSQRARLAEDRLAEVLSAYRNLKQENDGYRERTTRNIERRFDQRRERLVLRFIEILDNLDRALEAGEQSYAGQPLIEGLILVRTQLLQTLQEEGLERIPVLGLPYDPNFSEAVGTEEVEDPDHHQVVVKELMRGYRLNGRVARPSRVVIGEYRGAPQSLEATLIAALEETMTAEEGLDNPEAPPPAEGSEPSLEEIVTRAEAQEALFPDAFDEGKGKGTTSEEE